MKKCILLIAGLWLSIFSVQTYSMSLEQALNQFSTSLEALTTSFKGEVVPPPVTKTELEQLEEQLLVMIQGYINDLKNNEPLAKAQSEKFIDTSKEYFNKGGKNLTIALWQDLLTSHNVLNDFKYKDLADVFDAFKPIYTNEQQMLSAFNNKLNQLKDFSAIAEQDATTQKYYTDIVNATQTWIEKLEQEAAQKSAKPEEQQLLVIIDGYVQDLQNNKALVNTDNFIDKSNEYIVHREGTNPTILLWHNLLINDLILQRPILPTQQEIALLKNNLNELEKYKSEASHNPYTKAFYNKINELLKEKEAQLEKEESAESSEEKQLFAMIQTYITDLENKEPLFADVTNDFVIKSNNYINKGGTDSIIVFWNQLLKTNNLLQQFKDKNLAYIRNFFKFTTDQDVLNQLHNELDILKQHSGSATEEPAKSFYQSIVTSLQEFINKLEKEATQQPISKEEQQLLELIDDYVQDLQNKQTLVNTGDFIDKSMDYIVHHKGTNPTILLWRNLLISDQSLKEAIPPTSQAVALLKNNLNELEQYKSEAAKNPQTEEFYHKIVGLLEDKDAQLEKQLAAEEKSKAEITELETKLKQFIVANFSMPLALASKGNTEDLSQWKAFEDDYKKLKQLATQTNTSINRLIEFWYIRGYLKVNFEKKNLLQTTFGLMGNSTNASVDATLQSFGDFTKKYNDPQYNGLDIIGAPGDGKLSQKSITDFSKELPQIQANLQQQKTLIDYIKNNFSNPETGKIGDVSLEPVQSKLLTATNIVKQYKDLYEKYAQLEKNTDVLRPYAYWYYRSLLLTNYQTFKTIFNIGRFSAEAGYKIYEFNQKYQEFKPPLTLTAEQLKGLYLLNSLQQAAAGDNAIKDFVKKEGRSRSAPTE